MGWGELSLGSGKIVKLGCWKATHPQRKRTILTSKILCEDSLKELGKGSGDSSSVGIDILEDAQKESACYNYKSKSNTTSKKKEQPAQKRENHVVQPNSDLEYVKEVKC